MSAYELPDGTKFGIITEADRSATTLLLAEEYYDRAAISAKLTENDDILRRHLESTYGREVSLLDGQTLRAPRDPRVEPPKPDEVIGKQADQHSPREVRTQEVLTTLAGGRG